MNHLRVLFLTKYSNLAASSRQRVLLYLPSLRQLGWEVEVMPLLSDLYLKRRFQNSPFPALEVGRSVLRRFRLLHSPLLKRFDVIYLQYEALPRLPYSLEEGLYRQYTVVADFDDAIHEQYRSNPLLRSKIDRVMRSAAHVVAANRNLRDYAARFNSNVSLVPTVIDTDRVQARTDYRAGKPFVIGWVGTPVTAGYLNLAADALIALARRYPIVLRCLGLPERWTLPGVPLERIEWSEENERRAIPTFDVGIMPLPDDPFARGKSGFKLIQYMGCGVPAVASGVGANRDIIDDGANGLLAESPDEFGRKIAALLEDESLRSRLGRTGRATVLARYSLSVCAPRFARILKQAAGFSLPSVCAESPEFSS